MKDAIRDALRAEGITDVRRNRVIKTAREGKVAILTMHAPAVRSHLKQMSLDLGKTQQALLEEALNLLFMKYGRDPIA